jgi:hypothetical protein
MKSDMTRSTAIIITDTQLTTVLTVTRDLAIAKFAFILASSGT